MTERRSERTTETVRPNIPELPLINVPSVRRYVHSGSRRDFEIVGARWRNNQDGDNRGGLTSDRIDRFATFNADKKSVDEGCTICIDGVEINKLMIKLDCSHFYCSECIRKWFESSTSCPLYRKVYNN